VRSEPVVQSLDSRLAVAANNTRSSSVIERSTENLALFALESVNAMFSVLQQTITGV